MNSRLPIGNASTEYLDDEIFKAASMNPRDDNTDIPNFMISLYRWIGNIQKENNEVVEMTEKYGTFHFNCIVDPVHRTQYYYDLINLKKILNDLAKNYGETKFVLPDVFAEKDNIAELHSRIRRKVFKYIGPNMYLIDILDKDDKCIDVQYAPFDYIVQQIESFVSLLVCEMNKKHFTSRTILTSKRYIEIIRNVCYLCYKVLPKEDELKDYTPYEFFAPDTILRK